MASSASTFSFTDDEVSRLAGCDDQAEFRMVLKLEKQNKRGVGSHPMLNAAYYYSHVQGHL